MLGNISGSDSRVTNFLLPNTCRVKTILEGRKLLKITLALQIPKPELYYDKK